LSRLFVGMLLVAGATSLPELVIDVSAALGGAPDLAVGDLFGSSMANMAILAGVDLLRRHQVWPSAEIGHARVASVATPPPARAAGGRFGARTASMARLAGVALLRRDQVGPRVAVGHARVASVAIALTALATRGIITPRGVALGWIGIDTILIAVAYVAAVA